MHINQLVIGVKTVLFAFFISFSLSLHASNHSLEKPYIDHLSEVNKEWLHYKEACPKTTVSFHSDIDRIQTHLNLVIDHLKANSPTNLNSAQLSNRLFLLDKLQQYADKSVFPVNKHHLTRQPYFVDHLGTNCAVGQMIDVSGHKKLVDKISEEHNYDYIEDINTKGLKEWAFEFGFTIEELKWIQPAYSPKAVMKQVLGGTNGNVNQIEYNWNDGSLIIAGGFSELNDLPCLSIGLYKDHQLSCLGGGIDGTIHDVVNQSGDIYVLGELSYNGKTYPAAMYDGSSWNYIAIPNRDDAISTSGNVGGSGYQFEIAISHSSIPDHQEIWHLLDDDSWEKQADVKGVVLDIIASNYGRVHVGHFDSVTVYNANSTIDTTLMVNNVLIHENYTTHWYGIGSDISDTVNVVKTIGGTLIFGGTCSNQPGASNVCISRYFNSVLQPLYTNDSDTEAYSIHTIAYESGDDFAFGGNFKIQPFVGTHGSNLATYNLVSNWVNPIAVLDHSVKSVSFFENELYIGGEFQTNLGAPINYLGKIAEPLGIDNSVSNIDPNVYPNPFSSTINLEGVESGVTYSLANIDGRTVKNGTVTDKKVNDLDFLPKGTYLLKLETTNGDVVKKISK